MRSFCDRPDAGTSGYDTQESLSGRKFVAKRARSISDDDGELIKDEFRTNNMTAN